MLLVCVLLLLLVSVLYHRMSPEAINNGIFSTASDVFSYGVFVWELFSDGAKPWEGYRTIEVRVQSCIIHRV